MAPVSRTTKAKAGAPSRRAATPPAQQRRTAAARPATRRAAAEEAEEETTPFDAKGGTDDDDEEEDDEDAELPEVLDLSGIEAATYTLVPRGRYQGYIESMEYGLSQSSNQPMLTTVLKFDYEDKERTLRFYMTLGGDGAARSKATLARLDPDLDLSQLVPDEMDEHFADMEVMIAVTVRPDRDDRKIKRNNVQDIYPLDED